MAEHRHKRETRTRRLLDRRPRATVVAAPLAVLATTGAVGIGLLASGGTGALPVAADDVAVPTAAPTAPVSLGPSIAQLELDRIRPPVLSRGSARTATAADLRPAEKLMRPGRVAKAIKGAHTKMWTTTALNLWTDPSSRAEQKGELEAGKPVLLTGRSIDGRDEIVIGKHTDETRWVTSGYFSETKPLGAAEGLSMAPCPDPGVEYRLTANAVYVYRSVCHAFPQITTYGGYDNHGEHASGRALDIMTSDPALLTAIADYLRAHAAELHLYDVIRMQHIWTPVRSAEGWRLMPDRGSATANHYDHVHVSTY